MADDNRPSKRIKIDTEAVQEAGHDGKEKSIVKTALTDSKAQRLGEATISHTKPSNRHPPSKVTKIGKVGAFSQPSAISSGDRGIFVTCDKGKEKKCLVELYDLVLEHLEETGVNEAGKSVNEVSSHTTEQEGGEKTPSHLNGHSIEAEIAGELAALRENSAPENEKGTPRTQMQLITLDIPCVSFLRFPPSSTLDPVHLVHTLCIKASDPSQPQKCRYIKRLTPLSNLGKALSQGLDKACDAVLPEHFGPDATGTIKAATFAIRPTIRNCDKLNRDDVIKLVADRVQTLGEQKHKVDLKQYEKGVIIEAYRGWVGISVVDNSSDKGRYKLGYEALRRFNLAEIYANR